MDSKMTSKVDEEYNYDLKSVTGVAAFVGAFNKEDDDPGASSSYVDTSSIEYLRAACDTGRNSGPSVPKHTRQKMFFCDICDVECTSHSMYEQHLNGSKHAKKVRNLNLVKNEANPSLGSDQVKGGSKKSRVFSLREELHRTSDPVIGMHYIEELLAETNPLDFEPMYICNLCNIRDVGSQPMFAHIIGTRHRQKFLEMRCQLYNLDKPELRDEAKRIERRDGKGINLLKTNYSDIDYPFPPGKGPFASDNPKQNQVDSITNLSENPIGKLLESISACTVMNENDATLAYSVSSSLIAALTAYKVKQIKNSEDANLLISSGENLIDKLKAIYRLDPENDDIGGSSRRDNEDLFERRDRYDDGEIFSRRDDRRDRYRSRSRSPLASRDDRSHYY